jgi:hypothetical protein
MQTAMELPNNFDPNQLSAIADERNTALRR